MPQDSLPYSLPVGTTREWRGNLLTLTEEGWRCEVKHSMHRRCKGWDYCKPWIYMVTIDTQHHDVPPMPQIMGYRLPEWLERLYARGGHPHLFGELSDELDSTGRAVIRLNEFGRGVEEKIGEISDYHPEVQIIERVVMPNHVHFILWVKSRLPEGMPIGRIINMWKSRVNALYKELVLGVPKQTFMRVGPSDEGVSSEGSLGEGSLEPEAPSTRLQKGRAQYGGNGPKHPKYGLVFEPGFHDRILFRDGQLQTMIDYVRSNPQRLWEVVHNRQWFEKVAGWRITMPLLPDGGTKHAGRWWQYYPGGSRALMAEGGARGLLAPVEINNNVSASQAQQPSLDSTSTHLTNQNTPTTHQPSLDSTSTHLTNQNAPTTHQPSLNATSTHLTNQNTPTTHQPSLNATSTHLTNQNTPTTHQPSLNATSTQQPSLNATSTQQPNQNLTPQLPNQSATPTYQPDLSNTQTMSSGSSSNGLATITMTFNAIGNRSLLEVPERMQIQCSRSMTEGAIGGLIDDVLEACSHGVVIVSPCISEGEKRVARAVMEAGYQLVVLFPRGIPPQTDEYKPYGIYFEACARGQLLILSPWEFYAGEEKLTRWQCLMLNDIAAQLSM